VPGQFGTVLVRVLKVEPGSTRPFEAVEAEIKHQIALERGRPELLDLHDKIEDDRAAGLRLDEIAAKHKLIPRTLEVDRSGRDLSGNPVAELPSGVDVLQAAFASDVDVENDPLTLPSGGFAWFNVAAITPSRDRSLEEVKAQVETRWRTEQISERLTAKTTELVDKLKAGTSLAELASQLGVTVETLGGLKRGTAAGPLPASVVDHVFATANGAPGAAQGAEPTDRFIYRVTDVTLPAFDAASPDAKRNEEALKRSLSEDVLGAYIARLQSNLGVSINTEELRRFSGAPEAE
jgi:peptidyl-prolyl cis-trans isomerase D